MKFKLGHLLNGQFISGFLCAFPFCLFLLLGTI